MAVALRDEIRKIKLEDVKSSRWKWRVEKSLVKKLLDKLNLIVG